jgi:hypothetical protein
LEFDCVLVGDFEVKSYTVYADGNLRPDMADGSERTLDWEEWIDVRDHRVTEEWATQNPRRTERASCVPA